ncbi:MAG: hypothetical protein AABZ30_03620 [Myxococcota bacterium]
MVRTFLLLVSLTAACAETLFRDDHGAGDGGGGAGEAGVRADAVAMRDASSPIPADLGSVEAGVSVYGDADIVGDGAVCEEIGACGAPVDDGCDVGGVEECNGSDDDCDGDVDETCPCAAGDVQACFLGPPGRRGVGACVDGQQTCLGMKFPEWGDCVGGLWPSGEVCDGIDNNCSGCVDDDPECCEVPLACPDSDDLPEAAPFDDYTIDGTAFYGGDAASWSWTVVGGPCDQLLDATSGETSYTLTGAASDTLTIHFTLSGSYTVTMTAVAPDGTEYTCTFVVHVAGPGLRVELCWDTTGAADIDLHVHRPGTTGGASNWFVDGGDAINNDDCYYANCTAADYFGGFFGVDGAEWGYADSPLAECSGAPDGATWTAIGSCHNPRLDLDNIGTPGAPENVNVDAPEDGAAYRVMVHYYGGGVTTHPMVNVYCGGFLLGTYGAAPDLVSGFEDGGGFDAGVMWRVVDAVPDVDAGGTTTGCTLTPLVDPEGAGYWVTVDDHSY